MTKGSRFVEVFRGGKAGRGRWYWRQVGANGEITAASENYTRRAACLKYAALANPGLEIREVVSGPAVTRRLVRTLRVPDRLSIELRALPAAPARAEDREA